MKSNKTNWQHGCKSSRSAKSDALRHAYRIRVGSRESVYDIINRILSFLKVPLSRCGIVINEKGSVNNSPLKPHHKIK